MMSIRADGEGSYTDETPRVEECKQAQLLPQAGQAIHCSYQMSTGPLDISDGAPRLTTAQRMVQLDFTRGLAILMVMGYHFVVLSTHVVAFNLVEAFFNKVGWAGVDLFFVLSGFLVGGLLVGEIYRTGSLRIGRFITRRGFKIWPAYYGYLAFQVLTRHFPLSTFLLPNLLHLQNYMGTSLSHTWTLAVEEHFYLLLPLLLVFLHSSRRLRCHVASILGCICAAVLFIRIFMVVHLGSNRVWEYTHTRLDSLLFGVMLSYFYYYKRVIFDSFLRRRILLVILSAGGLLFLLLIDHASQMMLTFGLTINYISCGAFLLLMISMEGRLLQSIGYRAVCFIGLYSYSIYLWHLSVRTPLMSVCLRLPMINGERWIVLLLAQYASAIGLGILMARIIEWPLLAVREKMFPG